MKLYEVLQFLLFWHVDIDDSQIYNITFFCNYRNEVEKFIWQLLNPINIISIITNMILNKLTWFVESLWTSWFILLLTVLRHCFVAHWQFLQEQNKTNLNYCHIYYIYRYLNRTLKVVQILKYINLKKKSRIATTFHKWR